MVFARKDEPRTRNTRAAASNLLMQLEQMHVARTPFFLIALKSLFFGTTLFLGLSRHVFARKDEPRTRNTRAAASTLHTQLEQLHVASSEFDTAIDNLLGAPEIPQGSTVFGLGAFTSQSFHRVLSNTY